MLPILTVFLDFDETLTYSTARLRTPDGKCAILCMEKLLKLFQLSKEYGGHIHFQIVSHGLTAKIETVTASSADAGLWSYPLTKGVLDQTVMAFLATDEASEVPETVAKVVSGAIAAMYESQQRSIPAFGQTVSGSRWPDIALIHGLHELILDHIPLNHYRKYAPKITGQWLLELNQFLGFQYQLYANAITRYDIFDKRLVDHFRDDEALHGHQLDFFQEERRAQHLPIAHLQAQAESAREDSRALNEQRGKSLLELHTLVCLYERNHYFGLTEFPPIKTLLHDDRSRLEEFTLHDFFLSKPVQSKPEEAEHVAELEAAIRELMPVAPPVIVPAEYKPLLPVVTYEAAQQFIDQQKELVSLESTAADSYVYSALGILEDYLWQNFARNMTAHHWMTLINFCQKVYFPEQFDKEMMQAINAHPVMLAVYQSAHGVLQPIIADPMSIDPPLEDLITASAASAMLPAFELKPVPGALASGTSDNMADVLVTNTLTPS